MCYDFHMHLEKQMFWREKHFSYRVSVLLRKSDFYLVTAGFRPIIRSQIKYELQ